MSGGKIWLQACSCTGSIPYILVQWARPNICDWLSTISNMAEGQDNNKETVSNLEVKFVGGSRYDLSNLPKTKSGKRRRSFCRRKIPQQLEDIGL